jgi:hypothetical protein
VALATADPPFPEQVIEYVVVTVGLTAVEPEIFDAVKLLPLQDVALVELHDRVEDFPALIDIGLAASEAVGGGGAATVTVVDAVADPPFPEQVIE